MTQPNCDNLKEAQQEQLQQEQVIRNGSSNEFPAAARVRIPSTNNDSELFEIYSDSSNRITLAQDNNSNRNIVNEIQTLAANVAMDSVGAFSVDDILILHYEPNNNNSGSLLQNISNQNSNNVDNQLTQVSGILIRNKNNNNMRGCNRFVREKLRTYQPIDGPSNLARCGNFDINIPLNNASNLPIGDDESPVELEAEADEDDAESVAEERINDNRIFYNLIGDISELSTIALAAQNDIGSVGDASEMAELRNMEFNISGRNRRRRHGRSRRRHRLKNRRLRHRRNQMGRTLKKMNTILRKTALTLGLIESLILQQRSWPSGPPTVL